ncbi:hypothetical protein [Paenibacillus sp. P22]|uniref:hypothetical protein n=1 Tax=Paenibacillus sp. P22 TaxID=483908 RepID=UPI0003902CD1|nr:hypothetical protein [Paenibacillus sp. P22]CDN44920.1 hypothetical protein BN871_FY_00240 [Paenibacillus sp. P22]
MDDLRLLGRIVLSMSFVLLLLCLLSLTAVQRGSASYTVVMMALWINVILSGAIILFSLWDRHRRRRKDQLRPESD